MLREHDEVYKRLVPRSIETPEEIAAWREARKRNFPTKDKRDVSAATASSVATAGPKVTFKTRPCRFFSRTGSCRNGDKCTYVHDEQRHKAHATLTKARRVGAAKTPADAKRAANKPTLLKKLLAKDIAASNEPAVLAQCIAYIVANDFFDSVPLVLAVDGAETEQIDDDDDDDEHSNDSNSNDSDSNDSESSDDDDSDDEAPDSSSSSK